MDNQDHNDLTQEAKEKLRKKKEFEDIANVIINLFDNIIKRHNSIKDPATKYALLVDKLCMSVDVGTAILMTLVNEYDIEEELKIKIEDKSQELQSHLNDLMQWTTHPCYGPDHPYGQKIMAEAKKDYNGL